MTRIAYHCKSNVFVVSASARETAMISAYALLHPTSSSELGPQSVG